MSQKPPGKGTQTTDAPAAVDVKAMQAEIARLTKALADRPTPAIAAPSAAPMIQGLPKDAPKFKEAPRYRLVEKAFMAGIKVRQGSDWVPFEDVLLDPESMPFLNKLSGPFGGRGDAEREPIMVEFLGIPDEHLQPVNEAAEWMFDHIDQLKDRAMQMAADRRSRRKTRDPIEALTVIGPHATVLENTGT